MAHNTEYFARFQDRTKTKTYRILIQKEGFSGPETEINYMSRPPVTINLRGDKKTYDSVIQGSELIFNFMATPEDNDKYDSIFESEYREYKIIYEDYTIPGSPTTIFEGWLKPDNLNRDFLNNIYTLRLSAVDGFADLKSKTLAPVSAGKYRILNILKLALSPIEFNLDFKIQLGTWEVNYMLNSECALDKILIDAERLYTIESGETKYKSCFNVITEILNDYNLTLKQVDGYFVISNIYEINSFEFLFDWDTLIQQSRTAKNNVLDVDLKKYDRSAMLQKIPPVSSLTVIHNNKDKGGSLINNLDDWTGSGPWTLHLNAESTTEGINNEVLIVQATNGSYEYFVKTGNFSAAYVNGNEYVQISFKSLQFEGTIIEDFYFIDAEMYKASDDSLIATFNVFENSYNNYQERISPATDPFKIPSGGEVYYFKIVFRGDGAAPPIKLKVKDFKIVSIAAIEGDGFSDAVVFDKKTFFKNTNIDYPNNKEFKTNFGDVGEINHIGGYYFDDSGTIFNTISWRRFGKTISDDSPIIYQFAKNVLNDGQRFKDYLKLKIYDDDFEIDLRTCFLLDSRYYRIVTYQKDFRSNQIAVDIVEVITQDSAQDSPYNLQLSTIDGVQTSNSTVPSAAPNTDHNSLANLTVGDVHTQYLNQARGDARYIQASGAASQFIKGDGSLDSNVYYYSGNSNLNSVDWKVKELIAGDISKFRTEAALVSGLDTVIGNEQGVDWTQIRIVDTEGMLLRRSTNSGVDYYDLLKVYDGVFEFEAQTVWHSGNFGKTQIDALGIDADKLDGLEGSEFVQISGAQTITGIKTFASRIDLSDLKPGMQILSNKLYIGSTGRADLQLVSQNVPTWFNGTDHALYHADNANKSSIDWAAKNLTLKAAAEDTTVLRINEFNSNNRAFEIGFSGVNSPFIQFKRRYSDIPYNFMTVNRADGSISFEEYLNSRVFSTGFTGSGWEIKSGGSAEFQDLKVRGTFTVNELLINQIRATNGSLFVSDSMKYEIDEGTDATYFRIGIDTEGDTRVVPFVVNDIIQVQKWDGQNLKKTVAIIDDKSTTAGRSYIRVPKSSIVGDDFAIGDNIVRIGNTTDANRQGAIFLTNSENNSPYIEIYDGFNTTGSSFNSKVRLGKLNGITDPVFGALSGYGLYAENAYLTGSINSNAGLIAGWGIYPGIISNNADDKFIHFQNVEAQTTQGSSRGRRGLSIYNNNNTLPSANSVKCIRVGMLSTIDTLTTFPATPNYGIQIVKGTSPYKDIFRADASGALIAGWTFDETKLSVIGIEIDASNRWIKLGATVFSRLYDAGILSDGPDNFNSVLNQKDTYSYTDGGSPSSVQAGGGFTFLKNANYMGTNDIKKIHLGILSAINNINSLPSVGGDSGIQFLRHYTGSTYYDCFRVDKNGVQSQAIKLLNDPFFTKDDTGIYSDYNILIDAKGTTKDVTILATQDVNFLPTRDVNILPTGKALIKNRVTQNLRAAIQSATGTVDSSLYDLVVCSPTTQMTLTLSNAVAYKSIKVLNTSSVYNVTISSAAGGVLTKVQQRKATTLIYYGGSWYPVGDLET